MTTQKTDLLISIFVGVAAYFIFSSLLTHEQSVLLAIIISMVILWSNEALPLGVVSLLPVILFPGFGIVETNLVTPNYAKSIIFLFLGGFMLAIAVEKTALHKVISTKMLQIFPNTIRGMIYALAFTSGILSSFLSNSTTTLLLMPLALILSEDFRLKLRFALAIAYGASIGGIMTPIGTPPNLILFGIFDDLAIAPIPFMQWVVMMAPLAFVMFIFVGWLLSVGTSKDKLEPQNYVGTLTKNQLKVIFVLISLVVILFANAPIKPYYSGLGLNEKGLLLAFGLSMFFPPFNILTWEDTKKIPFDIIFLFGAGFSIAMAFTSTGLADELANTLQTVTHLPPYLLLIMIATLVIFTTEITSNTALISMILPVIYAVTKQNGLDTRLFMMVATICASYAFMLPIATPPNAVAMSSGAVSVKMMAKYGVVFNLAGVILVSLFAVFYWSWFL